MEKTKLDTKKDKEFADEYLSSLVDLQYNSKPLIDMLTILAEENIEHGQVIVDAVEQHISKVAVDFKLPALYLIDSIVKNVGREYAQLFSHSIVNIFCGVFEKVNEKVRHKMFSLRQTWNDVFPQIQLFTLDVKVNRMDPGWPITAKAPSIHVNPNFFKSKAQQPETDMQAQLRDKERELLELKKRKLELELAATKKHIEEQEKQLNLQTASVVPSVALKPDHIRPAMPSLAVNPAGHHHPHRTRIAPVNPALMMRMRDPRLAMKMQQAAAAAEKEAAIAAAFQQNLNSVTAAPIGGGQNQNDGLRCVSILSADSAVAAEKMAIVSQLNKNMKEMIQKESASQASRSTKTNSLSSSSPSSSSSKKSPTKATAKTQRSSKSSISTQGSSRINSSSSHKSSRDKNAAHRKEQKSTESRRKPRTHSTLPRESRTSPTTKLSVAPTETKVSTAETDEPPPTSTTPSLNFTKSKDYSNRNYTEPCERDASKSPPAAPSFFDQDVNIPLTDQQAPLTPQPIDAALEDDDIQSTESPIDSIAVAEELISQPAPLPIVETDSSTIAPAPEPEPPIPLQPLTPPPPPSSAEQTTLLASTVIVEVEQEASTEDAMDTFVDAPSPPAPLPPAPSPPAPSPPLASPPSPSPSPPPIASPTVEISERLDVPAALVDIKRRASEDQHAPDNDEPTIKKTKNENIDLLFGSEDVDLRKVLPPIAMIVPPPPPNISATVVSTIKVEDPAGWATIKAESPVPQRSSLDAVRAKLAEATRVKEVQQKHAKSRATVEPDAEDRRSRLQQELQAETVGDNSQDAKYNMIVTQAQQQFDNDAISLEQYNGLIKQVMQVQTHQKRESLKRKSTASKMSASPSPAMANTEPDENGICSSGDTDLRLLKRTRPDVNISDSSSDAMSQMAASAVATIDIKTTRTKERGRKSKWSQPAWERAQITPPLQVTTLPPPPPPVQPPQQMFPMATVQPPFGPIVPDFVPMAGTMVWSQQQQQQAMPFNQQQLLWQQQQHQQQMAAAAAAAFQQQQLGLTKAPTCRTITIDGVPREIRFYEEVAIAFMRENGGDPREIGFQAGERQVTVDQKDAIVLAFNDTYKPFVIAGETHQIRFGSPIRELYINGQWYECFFGDPPVVIPLAGQQRVFQISGPSPQVRIGSRRQDLVLGKIDMYVDGLHRVPLFLDGQQQMFELDGQRHSVQFADYLLTVLLDGVPMSVEYGGMPKRCRMPNGRDRSIRFSILPDGLVAGRVYVRNMHRTELHRNLSSPVPQTSVVEVTAPAVPIAAAVPTINIDDLFQKLLASGILGGGNKKADTVAEEGNDEDEDKEAATETNKANKERRERPTPIDLGKPETVKKRQPAYIHRLFSGMQCSSCGVRFPPEQTIKYSQHLDWHFRQNRRDRDSARRAHSRCWYYDVTDWIQYEEIEDLDEREKNWFETQQLEMQENGSGSGPGGNNDTTTGQPVASGVDALQPSCVAGPEDVDRTCDMCHDQFETFYNQETEEWHLRNAVRVEECTYHPICHNDYKKSLLPPEVKEEETPTPEDLIPKTDIDDVEKIVLDDDDDDDDIAITDDDVIVLPAEEPVITEICDEDETILEGNSTVVVSLDATLSTAEVPAAASSPQPETSTTADVVPTVNKGHAEPTYEPVGNESDVQILVPQISVLDLDEFEENPVDEAAAAIPVAPVKIKLEPKDDDDDDDGFEDVGTLEVVALIEDDSLSGAEDQATAPATVPQSMITSLDGNVQPQDTQPALTTNRIKINITKNVPKPAAELMDKVTEVAADTSSTTAATQPEPEQEITFEYKESMRTVAFRKLAPIRSGIETSGLCSIM